MEIRKRPCVPIDLSTHDRYLALLDALERRAAYIMLVPVSGSGDDPVLERAKGCMEQTDHRLVTAWPGTITGGKPVDRYIFAANKEFFNYLRQFPAFFLHFTDSWGCPSVSDSGFGYDDIAFLDGGGGLLFFTTTHEGYADGVPDLLPD